MIKGTTTLSAILLASLAGCAEMMECHEISGCQDFVRMSDGDGWDDHWSQAPSEPEPSRSEPDAGGDEPEDDDHDESDDDEGDDHDEDDEDD